MKYFIGIDPGATGGVAVFSEDGELIGSVEFNMSKDIWPIRNFIVWIAGLLREGPEKISIAIEAVHSMPNQGVKSTFAFGKNTGIIHGMILAMFPLTRIEEVPPKEWKKRLNLIGKEKKDSVILAEKLTGRILRTDRGRLKDGEAEAILIAYDLMTRKLSDCI